MNKGNKKFIITFAFCVLSILFLNILFIWNNSNIDEQEARYTETLKSEHEKKMDENYDYLMKSLDKFQLSGDESAEDVSKMLLDLKTLGKESENMTLPTQEKSDKYVAKYKSIKKALDSKLIELQKKENV